MTKSVSPLIATLPRLNSAGDAAHHVERLGVIELEASAENAGQVAHVLGDEEIALHRIRSTPSMPGRSE